MKFECKVNINQENICKRVEESWPKRLYEKPTFVECEPKEQQYIHQLMERNAVKLHKKYIIEDDLLGTRHRSSRRALALFNEERFRKHRFLRIQALGEQSGPSENELKNVTLESGDISESEISDASMITVIDSGNMLQKESQNEQRSRARIQLESDEDENDCNNNGNKKLNQEDSINNNKITKRSNAMRTFVTSDTSNQSQSFDEDANEAGELINNEYRFIDKLTGSIWSSQTDFDSASTNAINTPNMSSSQISSNSLEPNTDDFLSQYMLNIATSTQQAKNDIPKVIE